MEAQLRKLGEYLKTELNKHIKARNIRYESSGEIEVDARSLIAQFFKNNKGYVSSHVPEDKNEFPDISMKIKQDSKENVLFFEIKSAGSSKNPANDLGTLRSLWRDHILKEIGIHNLPNLFMVFIKYDTVKGKITNIDNVYIAHYFKFIGVKKAIGDIKLLSYRKKDGNLRPKSWTEIANTSPLILQEKEAEEFIERYYLTMVLRSVSIIIEHKRILSRFSDLSNLTSTFRINELGLDEVKMTKRIKEALETLKPEISDFISI